MEILLHPMDEKSRAEQMLWSTNLALAKGLKVRGGDSRKEEGHSDRRSRGLSHHSTRTDAGGLDFRVRNETGYTPPL